MLQPEYSDIEIKLVTYFRKVDLNRNESIIDSDKRNGRLKFKRDFVELLTPEEKITVKQGLAALVSKGILDNKHALTSHGFKTIYDPKQNFYTFEGYENGLAVHNPIVND